MSDFLLTILRSHPSLAKILANAEEYRVQVLLGLMKAGPGGRPSIEHHGYRVDAEYFYPASTVKLCSAVAALQVTKELSEISGRAVDERTPLRIHPCFADQPMDDRDEANVGRDNPGAITVLHQLRKLAIVSDNPAHNRLFALVGHREINEHMWALGLPSVRINHRLSEPRPRLDNLRTPQVDFLPTGHTPVTIPARTSDLWIDNAGLPGLLIGRAHMQGDVRIDAPMDFIEKNRFSLADQQRLLAMIVHPGHFGYPDLNFDPLPRVLLESSITMLPRECPNPHYSEADYPDHYAKFFLPGLARVAPAADLRITNKIGRAYGFSIDNAYIADTTHQRKPFYLSATIYANTSGLIGADTYDDTTIADPFFADLAEAVARALWK